MIELCHCKNNAFSGDADMVKLLLDYGASVNEGENDHFPDYPAEWTERIDATRAEWDGTALLLSAPLAPNSNHQGTGFGGSLYGVGVTAAWSVAELALADLEHAASRGLDQVSTQAHRHTVSQ